METKRSQVIYRKYKHSWATWMRPIATDAAERCAQMLRRKKFHSVVVIAYGETA